jgi:S1-C subfamily serine protease
MFNENNKVIGINTAASSGFQRGGAEGYAIPIDRALSVVSQIRSGKETDRIHIGVRGFLGVRSGDATTPGAQVLGVQTGSPADKAGIEAGDVITAVDGATVSDPSSLIKLIREHRPGDTVTVTWTTGSGQNRSAKVELAKGAAD